MSDVTDEDRRALGLLAELAREWEGTFTLTALYNEQSTRAPEPDWTVNLLYMVQADGHPPEPAGVFGVGGTITEAVQHAMSQLPTDDTPDAPQEET